MELLDKEHETKFRNIVVYAGTISDYEKWCGYEPGSVIECDTGDKVQGVYMHKRALSTKYNCYYSYNADVVTGIRLTNKLLDEGLVAIVNAKPFADYSGPLLYFGTPVKKRE